MGGIQHGIIRDLQAQLAERDKRIAELEAEVDAVWEKVLHEIERMRSTKRAAITSAYKRGQSDHFCPKCTKIGSADTATTSHANTKEGA